MAGVWWHQLLGAWICSQTNVIWGSVFGVTNIFMTQEAVAEAEDSEALLDRGQITWVVAAPSLGRLIGFILSGTLAAKMSNLSLVLLVTPLNVAGWIGMSLGQSFGVLLTSMTAVGLYLGLVDGRMKSYVSETASPSLRGTLMILVTASQLLTQAVSFGLGGAFSWRLVALFLGLTPSLIQFFGCIALPESARWLLANGRSEERVTRSIRFFKGGDCDVQREMDDITSTLGSQKDQTFRRKVMLLGQNMYPVFLLFGQMFFLLFSGGYAIACFSAVMFAASGDDVDPYTNSMYLIIPRFLSSLLCCRLIERLGRVYLLQVSAVLQLIGCLFIALSFTHQVIPEPVRFPLLLTGGLITNGAFSAVSSVTWAYSCELLPNTIRGLAINLIMVMNSLLLIAFIHFCRQLVGVTDYGILFWVLMSLNLLQMAFGYFLLPETQGLTLEEIQRQFLRTPFNDYATVEEEEEEKISNGPAVLRKNPDQNDLERAIRAAGDKTYGT